MPRNGLISRVPGFYSTTSLYETFPRRTHWVSQINGRWATFSWSANPFKNELTNIVDTSYCLLWTHRLWRNSRFSELTRHDRQRYSQSGYVDFYVNTALYFHLFGCKLTCPSRNRDPRLIKHECLRQEELPKPGTLVAIDAEFVSMQQVRSLNKRGFNYK